MTSKEKMLAFAKSKWHKVAYDMGKNRLGPDYLDCSSFVYYSLIAGGFLPKNSFIGNTETLYKLKGSVLYEIYSYDEVEACDIFITGYEGSSYGENGHTGIFTRKGEIIHCNALNNTVSINNEDSYIYYYLDCKRSSYERYFRPIDKNKAKFHQNIEKVRKIKDEFWTATCLCDIYVREYPSTNANIVAMYKSGDKINYDSVYEANGYRWLSYIGYSGKRRYVAYRDMSGYSWMKF